jgi:hypothetical protein
MAYTRGGDRPAVYARHGVRSFVRCLGIVVGGALLGLFLAGGASAQDVGAWLDAPLHSWNRAGMPIPPPPALGDISFWPAPAHCHASASAPSAAEEAQIHAAGWPSFRTSWRYGDLALVFAIAGYDGMCRPMGYNIFVFMGGRFAGTLSPTPMNSRFDGALLGEPTGHADGQIEAAFVRFRPDDARCCPSGPWVVVAYRIDRTPAGPVLVPEQRTVFPRAEDMPERFRRRAPLPRTGSPSPANLGLGGVAGVVIMAAGLVLFGVARRMAYGSAQEHRAGV